MPTCSRCETGDRVGAGGKAVRGYLLLGLGLAVLPARADELRLIAPHLPPFSYMQDGEPQGFMVRSLMAVAAEVGHSGKVSIVPIPRMLHEMANGSRLMSAFLARTAERVGKYQWLDPGVEEALSFATLASETEPMTLARARGLKAIATIGNGVPENFLRTQGFYNFDSSATEDSGLRKLLAGRVDAWFTSRWVIPAVIAQEAVTPGLIKLWEPVTRYPLFFAATLDVPADELAVWNRHLSAFRAAGGVETLMAPYRH